MRPSLWRGFTVRWRQAAPAARVPYRGERRWEPCSHCGSTERPYRKREMAPLSWVLVGFGVLLWPLLVLGLLLRQDVWRCRECHLVLRQARRLTLGR